MPRSFVVAVALALATSAVAVPADRLAKLIGDRVAGTPTACIDRLDIDKVRIVDRVGVLYEMKTGGVIYLNRPTSGLGFLHDGDVLSIERASPRLCSAELVRLINPNSRAAVASISLGQFTPYVRP